MKGRYLVLVLIGLGGWALLELMQWQAGLGRFAHSPQRLEVEKGLTAIVGGGLAGVTYVGSPHRRRAELIVRCKDGERSFHLARGDIADEHCGVRVELLDIPPGEKVAIEVTWDDDAT